MEKLQRQSKFSYAAARNRNVIARFLLKHVEVLARFLVVPGWRIALYRMMGVHLGKNVFIGMDCLLDSSFPELITIEDDVVISFRVTIVCHDHAKGLHATSTDRNDQSVAPVVLKRGCYIGAGVIILPGVTIGEDAVIGAGAVVTKDIPRGVTAVGVPARVMNS